MSAGVERPLGRVYDAAYAGVPNWDIGRPQRPFVRLVESGVLDSAMFHVLGDRERDAFVRELDAVFESDGLYCVLGDRRQDDRDVYGVSVPELRERFPAERWEFVHAEEAAFERRWGATPAVFAVLRRR
ncbi:hypothetical protein [Salarchaeum japonicum]|uniref:hypothetical protein n=1 Tax=Salarchaeum japonicum TaxID=555573 RepID=UPI001D0A3117|nr:hypothetical protein [Salarchaeum japonicum]